MKISGHLHERVIFTSGQITQLPYAQADGQPQNQYELLLIKQRKSKLCHYETSGIKINNY